MNFPRLIRPEDLKGKKGQTIIVSQDEKHLEVRESSNSEEESGNTLQDAIDAGAVLNKENKIDIGEFQLMLRAGDTTYTNEEAEISLSSTGVSMYAQNDGATDYCSIAATPTGILINKSGVIKEVATEEYVDNIIAASVIPINFEEDIFPNANSHVLNIQGLSEFVIGVESSTLTYFAVTEDGFTIDFYSAGNDNKMVLTPGSFALRKTGMSENKQIATINPIDNYVDDITAAASGIIVGEQYHTNGAVKVRLT